MMKRVLVVFPHTPNPRMIKRIKALLEKYEVYVIYWDRELGNKKNNRIPKEAKVKVIKRKSNEGNPLGRIGTTMSVIREIISITKGISPDAIYLSKTDVLISGFLYKYLVKKDTHLIYEVSDMHTLMIDKQKGIYKRIISLILNKLECFLSKSIALLVVTSEYFYQNFYINVVSKEKVLFIPNTPDPRVFDKFERKNNDIYTVGFIGSVRYASQLEMLIDISIETNINVLIAGGGRDFFRIKEYAEGFKNVEIYGEYEYESEIKSLYEKVNCIFAVYDTELTNVRIALPNRLYEAIYTNTPIIAARDTYLGDIVEKYQLGRIITHNNKFELIQAIKDIKSDSFYENKFIANNEELRRSWSLKTYTNELLDRIDEILVK